MKRQKIIGLLGAILFVLFMASATESISAQVPSLQNKDKKYEEAKKDAMAICPPIYLRDENGNIIDPVKGINAHVPYSPEKTCGRCHDYKKITEGYHFTQGKGEKMTKEFAARYPWCTSPGQYGGRW